MPPFRGAAHAWLLAPCMPLSATRLDIRHITLQEISFVGTNTCTAEDFCKTAQAMNDAKLGNIDWFEMRALEDGADAFAQLGSGSVASPKIILDSWS